MSPLLSSCAIVVCVVGMGSQHPAASESGAPSISPGLVFWWVLASSAVELPYLGFASQARVGGDGSEWMSWVSPSLPTERPR